jgi:hypothetical protein
LKLISGDPGLMTNIRLLLILFLFPTMVWSQSTNASLNEDYYHTIDRYEVKAGRIAPELFTTIKPYQRSAIVGFIDSLQAKDHVFTSRADQFNYEYLMNDSWERSHSRTNDSKKPFLKYMYKKKSDLGYVDIPDFDIHVSPVLYVGGGVDSRLNQSLFTNTRGIEIRGMVDRKIGFYTFLSDNQARLPAYVQDQMSLNPVVPHVGFWKTFKTGAVDYLMARGYIDFNISRHIYMQFGNDRTFIGNGFRSLIFSDYSPPNLFLKANLKIWKLNYMFQLNRMTADAYGTVTGGSQPTNERYPEKYMAFHHVSINIGKKLNIGLFESVIFSSKDSTNRSTFDISYLNPVIFYRAQEQQGGSSDNVILGGDFKWNAMKGVSFYGQVVIDEFNLKEIRANSGWWANKFAGQLGMKYIDVAGIQNLDLQLEANAIRPYTYSHDLMYDNYSNFRQPIAHPMGANLAEIAAIVRYQPLPRLTLIAKSFYTKIGRDTTNVDWGADILKNYHDRHMDYGNKIGQGIKNTVAFLDLTASYQLKHNLFIDVRQLIRSSKSPVALYNTQSSVFTVALRLNIARNVYDF